MNFEDTKPSAICDSVEAPLDGRPCESNQQGEAQEWLGCEHSVSLVTVDQIDVTIGS